MSKKMYPENSSTSNNTGEQSDITTQSGVDLARQYDLPVYRENAAGAYIEFRAYDPNLGKMRRKTIKLNKIKGIKNRRDYARGVIKRLNEQLKKGWNPWIAKDTSNLVTFEEALQRYISHIEKMLANGYFRKETYDGYKSYVKIMREYIKTKRPTYYCYQFDRSFCVDFLDYVFIERNNGAQTRNNYLNFLRVFCGFLVEKGYLASKPTDGIVPISKRLYKKERECIPLDVVGKIADYCKEKEPDFLFACYLLYYCFIRPVEMTRLKVRHFNLKECTLTIPGELSKNKKTQTVTIPKKVIQYGIEIGVFSAPMDDFVFSYRLKPGSEEIDPKHFRDHWENVRKALKLKSEWKFYSLKDTGITEMLKRKLPSIEVRDQARHSSLAITDIYTDHNTEANKDIVSLDGAL
ncbi:MAG: tyrosine-type recombinase/integrase [Muribaculum sp.]|nr:tyrosine-type recombinase/integrase [Muribaculum sp.]